MTIEESKELRPDDQIVFGGRLFQITEIHRPETNRFPMLETVPIGHDLTCRLVSAEICRRVNVAAR